MQIRITIFPSHPSSSSDFSWRAHNNSVHFYDVFLFRICNGQQSQALRAQYAFSSKYTDKRITVN
jgi:hypothetical protein